ncbi:alpha-amylase family glycosyl hydrolase [Aerococcaceae bacterium WGS1372]
MKSKRLKLLLIPLLSTQLVFANKISVPLLDSNIAKAEAVEDTEELEATVNQPIQPNSHSLLTVEWTGDMNQLEKLVVDTSQLGGSKQLVMSTDLGAVTLSVNYDVEAGIYYLPITATDKSGNEYYTEAEIEVIEPDSSEKGVSWDEEIIYFVLTDRFQDGDPTNNNPYNLDYKRADNQRGVYQGGDFKGITESLDYLEELGVTTIWISPIVSNIKYDVSSGSSDGSFYGYHGYWAEDFESLNAHFGNLEDFHELIDASAERDIKIMVDVVLNHAGYGMNPEVDVNDEEVPQGYPIEESRAKFEGMIRQNAGVDSLTQELSGLPDFLTEDPIVYEQLVDWQTAWLELSTTDKGNAISSFRVDTVIHVDNVAWQHFRNELTKLDPTFNLIGEVWGASAISPKGYLNSGMMDSVLDFAFKDYARNFINGDIRGVNSRLIRRNESITSSAQVGQFLSSHDEVGFLYTLAGDVDKFKLAVSLQLTAKGQPVIYYGEEIGLSGANNWPFYDNRYDFDWEATENNEILNHYKKLIQFRKDYSDVITRGDRSVITESVADRWTIVERFYNDEQVYIVFNLSDTPLSVELPLTTETTVIDYYSEKEYEVLRDDDTDTPILQLELTPLSEGGTMLLVVEDGEIVPFEVE